MNLTMIQSFLEVISLNLVLYWLCQVLMFFFCFLVNVLVLAWVFFLLSPILMFLEIKSLLITLVFPSTTVNSISYFLGRIADRSQHLIKVLLNLLKNVNGMFSYSSWLNDQLLHSGSTFI